jgi:hypothetical protein
LAVTRGKAEHSSAAAANVSEEAFMEYVIKESHEPKGAYSVIAVNQETGETLSVLFSGLEAKKHAEEYAAWKNGQSEITGEQLMRR